MANIKTTQEPNGTLVEFTRQTGSKVTTLLYFEALASLSGSLIFIYLALDILKEPGDYLIVALVLLGAAFVCFLAFRRYFGKATAKERLRITPGTFTIVNATIFKTSEKQYNVSGITNMQFMGKQQMTDHPLKGQSFDYMGFQTQQEVINTVHDEGNISFDYEGKTIFFAKAVPSWDVEELDKILRQITGDKLSITNLPENIEDYGTDILTD